MIGTTVIGTALSWQKYSDPASKLWDNWASSTIKWIKENTCGPIKVVILIIKNKITLFQCRHLSTATFCLHTWEVFESSLFLHSRRVIRRQLYLHQSTLSVTCSQDCCFSVTAVPKPTRMQITLLLLAICS